MERWSDIGCAALPPRSGQEGPAVMKRLLAVRVKQTNQSGRKILTQGSDVKNAKKSPLGVTTG